MTTTSKKKGLGYFLAGVVLGIAIAGAPSTAKEAPPSVAGHSETAGPTAYWVEDKPDGTRERISGDVRLAPAGAHSFADRQPEEDEPAWDCLADGNGVCGASRPALRSDTVSP